MNCEEDCLKNKFATLDLTKFLMAVFVVAIHTHPLETVSNNIILNIYEAMIRLAVPFFFIASGFFCGLKSKTHNSCDVLISYLKRILILYCKWSIIYLPLAVLGYWRKGFSLVYSIILYIRNFFFVGDHYNSYPLWYLLGLSFAIAFIYFLVKMKLSMKKFIIFSFLMLLISSLLNYICELNCELLIIKIYKTVFVNGRIWSGFCPVMIGFYIGKCGYNINKQLSIFLFFILFLITALNLPVLTQLCNCLSAIVLFLICLQSNNLPENWNYVLIRKMSIYVYFIHMYVWTFFTYIIIKVPDLYGFKSFVVTVTATTVLSFILSSFNNNKIGKNV